ncbi:repressor of the inhibitor of the protein kinase [Amphibalanus amphitrite]|uniref:Repressor of the inhibitor of the protein kinase n=1 Tax=Amphibalanus amphitrite TaxID=1232801 RepID=A0A6A4WCR3_AMPAM|nr:repressor of the inhibitor of the protein kinase [Amphibalanus amphitrite]
MGRASDFKERFTKPDLGVAAQLETAGQREKERRRAVLGVIVDTLKMAAVQNIPLRGHRDDGRIDPSGEIPPENDGNFRMLLRLRIQAGDVTLQKHLKEASGNALYTSKTIQNAVLEEMATMIQQKIAEQVRRSGTWAIIADETTDRANREQMALVARYVADDSGVLIVREDPFALVDVFSVLRQPEPSATDQSTSDQRELRMSGANLAKVISNTLGDLQFDTRHLVAQCYDGAAAMASSLKGVSAHIRASAPLAHYFHCTAHALNLATSKMDSVTVVRNASTTLESLVVFLTDGAKRMEQLCQAQAQELEEAQRLKLLKLCKTRFVERHVAVDRFWNQLPAIQLALQLMSSWEDRRTSAKAAQFLAAMRDAEFLVGLAVARRLSGILMPLARSLQEKGADLIASLELADTTREMLDSIREDSEKDFADIMTDVTAVAHELDVEVKKPRLASRSVYRENAGPESSAASYFRINVFNPALDAVRTDLAARFSQHQKAAFAISHLLPKRAVAASWGDVRPAWENYRSILDCSESQMRSEFDVWAARWKRSSQDHPETAIGALNRCPAEVFPGVHALLRVLAVIPASTAEAERTFSKVTRTLTAVRASMSEERLEALVLLQAHRDLLPPTSAVVDRFASSGARRFQLGNH